MFNVKQTINNVQFINTKFQLPSSKLTPSGLMGTQYYCVSISYTHLTAPNTKTRNLKLETKNNEHPIPKTSNQKL